MGGRKPEHSTAEFLQVFEKVEGPVVGTSEFAEHFGYSTQGGAEALKRLEDRNLVSSKRLGNARAWWITDAGREYLEDAEGDHT